MSSVAVLLTIIGLLGLFLFAHELNAAISISVLNAQAFAERAEQRHESFVDAAKEFEARDAREGEHSFAGFPRPQRPPASHFGPPGPPPPRVAGPQPPQIAVLKDLAEVYESITADINSGKYPSAQEAQRSLQQKLQSIISNTLHKHPPATSAPHSK